MVDLGELCHISGVVTDKLYRSKTRLRQMKMMKRQGVSVQRD